MTTIRPLFRLLRQNRIYALILGLLCAGIAFIVGIFPDTANSPASSDLWIAYIGATEAADPNDLYYGGREIFLTDFEGDVHYQLTDSDDLEESPAWSPDGTWLAFNLSQNKHYVSYDEATWMQLDQPSIQCGGYSIDTAPIWSPDGRSIAFSSVESTPNAGIFPIYISPPESCQPVRLLPNDRGGKVLDWSPDGAWIVFVAGWKGALYRMHPDGSNVELLVDDPEIYQARWSPDGQWIAFETTEDTYRQIYRIRPDGTGRFKLAAIPRAHNHAFAWSPDGQWFVFGSLREVGVEERTGSKRYESVVYRARADGTELARIGGGTADSSPVWSPDGAWLAFTSERSGKRELYRMRPDGTDARQLTHDSSGSASSPAWVRIPAARMQALRLKSTQGTQRNRWIGAALIISAILLAGLRWRSRRTRARTPDSA